MNYKNFSIDPDINHNDYDQHLNQLDNLLEQFQDERFEWYLELDWDTGCFWLSCCYKNNGDQRQGHPQWKYDYTTPRLTIITKTIKFNPNYLQCALSTMKMLISHPQISYEYECLVDFDIDENKICFIDYGTPRNEFWFPLTNLDLVPNLISNTISFNHYINTNRNNQNLKDSLELQVLKMIIDNEVDQSSDQFLQKLKRNLANSSINYETLSAEDDENGYPIDENMILSQLDWNFHINKNQTIKFDPLVGNQDNDKYEFKPLELSFQAVAKLTNDPQIQQILKAWKTNLNAKTKDRAIYNKF